MIIVDTSVWVSAARNPQGPDSVALQQLIDADEACLALPVRMELLAGVKARDRRALARALTALPVVVPSEQTWNLAEGWVAPAAEAGHRFAVTDLVIAALAEEIGGLVWSLDSDFARLESLGRIRRYERPA